MSTHRNLHLTPPYETYLAKSAICASDGLGKNFAHEARPHWVSVVRDRPWKNVPFPLIVILLNLVALRQTVLPYLIVGDLNVQLQQ